MRQTSSDGTRITAYQASNSVQVTAGIGKSGELVDAAVGAGANNVDGPNLDTADKSSLYDQALKQALGDAKGKAQAIADAAGLTLGAGSGWLERMYGYTSHNLLAAEVVTADGRLLHASQDENADLFWGLRGGGGNFGVVTQFEYRLHGIGPMVAGGMVLWPLEQAGEAFEAKP